MSTIALRSSSIGMPRESGLGRGLRFMSLRVYRALRDANRRAAMRRARRELLAMPDYMLADIGIDRGEISHAVRYGRSDDIRFLRGQG